MRTCTRLLSAMRESGDHVDLRDLARRIGVHRSTLYRALEELRLQGAKFERACPSGKRGSIRLVKGPAGEEAVPYKTGLALNIAGLVLCQAGTDLWAGNLANIQDLAESRMSKKERGMVEALTHRFGVRGTVSDTRELPQGVLENLLAALGGEVTTYELDFTYKKDEHAEAKPYRVVPYKLIQDTWVGGTYLLAWVPADGTIRNFKVERMLSARASEKPGVIPVSEKIEQQFRYFLGGWTGPQDPITYEVQILSTTWVNALRETEPGLPDLSFDHHDDGTMTVRFKAVSDVAPLRWVLQFGACAKVIAPLEFKAKVIEALQATTHLYELSSNSVS